MTDAAPAAHPASAAERILALDAIRGVAILGVLFAYTVWSLGNPPSEAWSALDRAVEKGMGLFVDGKFLSTFAFLFGLGITQQWRRWEAAGLDPWPLHARRMGFLLVVGLVHGALLRNGDILAPYAILGFVLFAFRRAPTVVVVGAMLALLAVPTLTRVIVSRTGIPWPSRPGAIPGGYIAENLTWLRYWYLTNPFVGFPVMLFLMLAGLLVGRAELVPRMAKDRALTVRVLVGAIVLAVLTRIVYDAFAARLAAGGAPSVAARSLRILMYDASCWTLAAVYAAGILLVAQSARGAALLRPLAAQGRMAFTNYLSQATIIVPLCLAFGWFDHVSPAGGLALALALGALQLLWSSWWLGRFRMGPLERAWRTVTYGSGNA